MMRIKWLLLAFLMIGSIAQAQQPIGVFSSLYVGGKVNVSPCVSSASPAVCIAQSAGFVAVPTGTNPTLVVNTSAVTANSMIFLTPDESLGTALGITCNSTVTTQAPLIVTARTANTSFTIQVDATVATNKVCLSYLLIN